MASCELCGAKAFTAPAQIEGSKMYVCKACSGYGRSMKTKPIAALRKAQASKELVSNYHELIRKARQRRQLTQSQLAARVAEKESVIQHLETASARPSDQLAKKLEKFLDIVLLEDPPQKAYFKLKKSSGAMTLGDLLKKK